MDYKEIKTYAEACLRDTSPPCVSACPLGVDVRGMVSKVRAGRIDAAYRAYRESVLFPNVVSAFCEAPCRDVCVRGRLSDGFVDLPEIERRIVKEAKQRAESRYAIPPKKGRVAVLGAGLAGLACAWRLASKGYRVTVFETKTPEAIEKNPAFDAALAADRGALFGQADCAWRRIEMPEDTQTLIDEQVFDGILFDAVFEAQTPGPEWVGVAVSIARGLAASSRMEEQLRIGDLSGAGDGVKTGPESGAQTGRGRILIRGQDALSSGLTPVDERFYNLSYDFEEGAGMPAADRCLLCNCSACIDVCPMIRFFRQNPKRMAADLGVSVLPVDNKIQRVASRMISSCNLCGLCASVCPAGVDTCTAMEASRAILQESGHLAPAYHDFWMSDLAFSMSEEAYGLVYDAGTDASAGGTPPVLFFPGCQLTASLPDTVARTFDFIRSAQPGAAMLLACCGIPADWAAEKTVFSEVTARLKSDIETLGNPEVLFACSACKKTFEKSLPGIRGRLVYEWLAEGSRADDGGFPADTSLAPAQGGDSGIGSARKLCAAVYDPCNSRMDRTGQAAVRLLAEKSGYSLEELCLSKERAACCGFGGHIYPANPAALEKILDECAADRPELLRIAYCANCRDLFLYKGIESRHILEIRFPSDEAGQNSPESAPDKAPVLPTLTQRRENRRLLKKRYIGETGYAEKTPSSSGQITLEISPQAEAQMDRLLLLHEDVEKTVLHCEENNAKVIVPESGRSVGFFRDRLVTVWVVYEILEDGHALVHNVYTHRMEILE